jgi:hypothetical protein
MRIGAGELGGGFGRLWTKRYGLVQMYVSRTEGVCVDRAEERPTLAYHAGTAGPVRACPLRLAGLLPL